MLLFWNGMNAVFVFQAPSKTKGVNRRGSPQASTSLRKVSPLVEGFYKS